MRDVGERRGLRQRRVRGATDGCDREMLVGRPQHCRQLLDEQTELLKLHVGYVALMSCVSGVLPG